MAPIYQFRTVMAALVAGIHALATKKGVDGRVKPGHDVKRSV
jgi:hypothetical protein